MVTFGFLGILGLVFGSFLGALTYRFPRSISIAKGRSVCPKCKKEIGWYDNIPLFSFLLLGGHCRNCHEKISIRYPLIELVTAITFIVVGFNLINLVLVSVLISIFVIDMEHEIIPDESVFFGLFIFLINSNFNLNLLLPGFLSAIFLLVLNIITKGKVMGLGEVKLALLLGTMAGPNLFLNWLFFSFATGAVVGILLVIGKKATMKQKIAFGPFLIIGFLLALFIK